MARKAAPALRRSSSSIISACPSAVEQLAWPQSGIELVEAHDFAWRPAAGEMRRHELTRMIEACGGDQLRQSMECRSMEVLHPHPFVVDHQSTLPGGVLRSHANRASVGMAALGLDAAEREHESAGCVAPVGAERHGAGDIEGRHDLAAGAELDAVAGIDPDQRIVNETQPFAQGHAEMVDELERRSAGAAFLAIDDDKIRIDAGLQHGLAYREEFPRMSHAEFESRRLAARQPPHLADKFHHFNWR